MKGKVLSGKRHCSQWPPDLYELYKKHSGLTNLKTGTLNVDVGNHYLLEQPTSEFSWRGKNIVLKECKISFKDNERIAYIIRNDVDKTHPYNIIELISDIRFKEKWEIKDGNEVHISFN